MSAIVPATCPIVSAVGAANREPVRGPAWQNLGAASNHLLGRGGALVPPTYLGGTGVNIAKGGTATFRVTFWPRYQATHRIWTIAMSRTDSVVTFTDPSGGTSNWHVLPTDSIRRPQIHLETISGRVGTVQQKTVTIANSGSSADDAIPIELGCYEVPRPELAIDANDLGVNLNTLGGERPMYFDTGKSIGGVVDGIEAAVSVAKRNGLLYILRDTSDAFTFTSTSAVSLLAMDPSLLERKKYRGETTRDVEVYAYGRTGATTTLALDLTASSGDSLTLSWSAGDTGSWKNGTLAVNVEDLSDARGERGGAPDTISIQGRRPTGSNAAAIESVCIGGT